jgi:signal transduction histidine kinase/CheY-like chemotaxis protein
MSFIRRFLAFANETYGLSQEQVSSEMKRVYQRGDRLLGYFILGHVAVAALQGFAYNTWSVTIPVTLAATAMFFTSVALLPGTAFTRTMAGVTLQIFVALHIYQMHGLPEMHFYFFTAQTMLIVYEDWRSTWVGTVFIIAQHILFAVLQNTGSALYFFPDSYITVRKLALHFSIAVMQVAICNYWAISQRRHRLRARWQQAQIEAERQKAEQATQAKSQFLANMSHEIRTPMNGVLGMTGVLLDAPLSADQRECVEAIQSSGESLLNLLNGILDISKVEAGHMHLDPVEFRLRELVEGIATLLAPKVGERDIQLAVRIDPQIPATVVGDPTRLRQILLNLASNAIKFTFEGHVLIQVALVERGANRCRLQFSVSDTGIGIPEEKQAMIFDRFSQADTSTTRRFGGTGLGLAISQELVGLMGGRITVTSSPNQSTRFSFEISLPAAASAPATHPLRDARVLVLDPSPLTRSILSEMLSAWGARVTAVGNLNETGGFEQYQVAVAASGAFSGGSYARALPIPLVIVHSKRDELPVGDERVKPVHAPAASAELLDAVLALLSAPLPETRPDTEERRDRSAPPILKFHVLVAEDNPVNQRVARLLLERLGCTVDIAQDGLQAVEMWGQRPYDVVLMDCQMPERDGFEATAAIRRAEAELGTHTPIIAMTANAMSGDRERCLRAGMDNYLAKPVGLKQISQALLESTSRPQVGA